MPVFVKRARTANDTFRLQREFKSAVIANKILGRAVPVPTLNEVNGTLAFPFLGKRDEFLDKIITKGTESLDDAVVCLAELVGKLHYHAEDYFALPERMPSVPMTLEQIDSMGTDVASYICNSQVNIDRIRALTLDSECSFIHGDLTLDNIHLDSNAKSVSIVDWELAGNGVIEDDLSSVISSIVSLTLLRIAAPKLTKKDFAVNLLDAYRLAFLFLKIYERRTSKCVNEDLLELLFTEKLRC